MKPIQELDVYLSCFSSLVECLTFVSCYFVCLSVLYSSFSILLLYTPQPRRCPSTNTLSRTRSEHGNHGCLCVCQHSFGLIDIPKIYPHESHGTVRYRLSTQGQQKGCQDGTHHLQFIKFLESHHLLGAAPRIQTYLLGGTNEPNW